MHHTSLSEVALLAAYRQHLSHSGSIPSNFALAVEGLLLGGSSSAFDLGSVELHGHAPNINQQRSVKH